MLFCGQVSPSPSGSRGQHWAACRLCRPVSHSTGRFRTWELLTPALPCCRLFSMLRLCWRMGMSGIPDRGLLSASSAARRSRPQGEEPFPQGDASLRGGSGTRLTGRPCKEKFVTDQLHFSALFEDIVLSSLELQLLGNWSQLQLRGEELPKGAAVEDAAEEGSRLRVLGEEGQIMAHTAPLPGQVLHVRGAAFGWQCHASPSQHDCAHAVLPVVGGSLGTAQGRQARGCPAMGWGSLPPCTSHRLGLPCAPLPPHCCLGEQLQTQSQSVV